MGGGRGFPAAWEIPPGAITPERPPRTPNPRPALGRGDQLPVG